MNISVIVPLYNKKDTIERALNSIINQTLKPVEIIVVNDGSTDGSDGVVEGMNLRQLRLISQENAGVSAARNKGLKLAKCEWVAFLDADDEWLPTFLEEIIRIKDKYPGSSIYATAYFLVDHEGNQNNIKLNNLPFKGRDGILNNYFRVASCSNPPVWSSAVCINKKDLLEIRGFPYGVIAGEDLLTWARLAVRKDPVYLNMPLAKFYLGKGHVFIERPGREPQDIDYVGIGLKELIRDSKKHRADLKKYLSHWYKMRASIYLRLNMHGKALVEIYKGILQNPFNFKLYIYIIISVLPDKIVLYLFRKLSK